jgi:hypothetical protein
LQPLAPEQAANPVLIKIFGDEFLNEFTAQWCETFMQNWERAIDHYLSTGTKLSE